MRVNSDFSRGALIAVVFGLILFGLIPAYVPRPAFIPGFAPPPDMWPRVVSMLGMAMGLGAMIIALAESRQRPPGSFSIGAWCAAHAVHLLRFAYTVAVFAGFLILIPYAGFLGASMLLAGACFVLTGDRRHKRWMVGLTIALPVGLYSFFATVMNTPFPKGALGRLLGLG